MGGRDCGGSRGGCTAAVTGGTDLGDRTLLLEKRVQESISNVFPMKGVVFGEVNLQPGCLPSEGRCADQWLEG